MSRTTVYKDDVLKLQLEFSSDDYPYIHCDTYTWSKEKYKHHKKVWDAVLSTLHSAGHPVIYALIRKEDKKLQKFSSLFGFKYLLEYPYEHPEHPGINYVVYGMETKDG